MATAEEILTARILADLEAGNLPPWRKPWRADVSMPRNARTGKAYRGGNVWLLLFMQEAMGYSDPRWMTYKQANDLGGSVRKGEKGTPVVFWKIDKRETVNADGETEQKSSAMLRFYTVFNVAQTDGCKVAPLEVSERVHEPIAAAEAIIAGMPNPPRIVEDGSRACYSPALDLIQLPHRADFETNEAFYATANHELVHSTGHVNRLARTGVVDGQHFGSDGYGREELVAEMGAAFLNGESGIAPATIENTASYLASWIRTIKENPRVILAAAGAAQKATDYILGRTAGSESSEA